MASTKFETNLLHCYWAQLLRNLSDFLKKILCKKGAALLPTCLNKICLKVPNVQCLTSTEDQILFVDKIRILKFPSAPPHPSPQKKQATYPYPYYYYIKRMMEIRQCVLNRASFHNNNSQYN